MKCECMNLVRLPEQTDGVFTNHHPNCPSFEGKKRYINIKLIGDGNYTMPADKHGILTFLEEIKESEIGERWEVKLIEMYEEEYNQLPEFMGH